MKLWVVGRNDVDGWKMRGVYNDETLALKRCEQSTDFIGPLNLNEDLPDSTLGWQGLYFPHEQDIVYKVSSMHSTFPLRKYHYFGDGNSECWTLDSYGGSEFSTFAEAERHLKKLGWLYRWKADARVQIMKCKQG